MVNQFLLKVVSAISPVLLEVHRQVACDELPGSIRHEACDVHFPHGSVDDGHASLAIFPSLDELLVGLPVVRASIINAISAEALVAMSYKPEFVEIAPEELRDEVRGVLAVPVFGDVRLRLMVYFPDGERTVRKPRRKFT